MNQTRVALSIQFFHSFVSGVFGVAIPLMMKARAVDVVVMGLVFAVMPLIMQFGRMLFATISDFFGRKIFFALNGVLGFISSMIYRFAYTPMEFLFGKVAEGTKEGAIWAVNRAFLLEREGGNWKALVHLRTVVYISSALGSAMAGFLIVWVLFEGTMLFCAVFGILTVLAAALISSGEKKQFSMEKALQFLDFRKKTKIFKIFLFAFSMIGLSYGFIGGYVITNFLKDKGFIDKVIGVLIGARILFAGFSSYLLSKTASAKQILLVHGILYSLVFLVLGFLGPAEAGTLIVAFGFIEGMSSIGQEGILSKICNKESYGTDIGLLMFGLHMGETISLALSGFLIAAWGFAAPFLLAALTYTAFYMPAYIALKD
ncbi:MAG: MFS transporter [Candidatus Bathyarchaeia archaeon]